MACDTKFGVVHFASLQIAPLSEVDRFNCHCVVNAAGHGARQTFSRLSRPVTAVLYAAQVCASAWREWSWYRCQKTLYAALRDGEMVTTKLRHVVPLTVCMLVNAVLMMGMG
jgi:hypothetical protein